MYVPDVEVHRPSSLAEASSLKQRLGSAARFLAGGTDLLVDLKTGRVSAPQIVSLNGIDELRGITEDEHGLRIGALATANQLAASPIVKDRYPAILDATRDMAAPQIRNMATVGGNIACAVPSADLPPILLVMQASVVLWSGDGARTVPLESFFVGPRQTVRRDDEVLTTVLIPRPLARFGAAYARFALRAANACAVAGVAASLRLGDNNCIESARLALCAVAPKPILLLATETMLVGEVAGEDAFARAAEAAIATADPIADIRGSDTYRRELVGVLTRRALRSAWQRASRPGGG